MNKKQPDSNIYSLRYALTIRLLESNPWMRYAVAISIIIVAAALRWVFLGSLGVKAPYMTFYPAVMIATLICGFHAGILATFLSALMVSYFWNEPLYQLAIQYPADQLAMIAFILCCSVVVYLTAVLRRAEILGMAAEAQLKLLAEREHMEKILQQSEERYRKVVEDQTDAISRYTTDGTYTFVNEVFCRIFGKTKDELLGSKWHPDAFPEDLQFVEDLLRTMSPSNPVVVIENRILSSSGDVRWMQFVNRGFFDKEGRLIETQAVGRDITERKRSEEQLIELNRKLRDLNEHLHIAVEQERLAIARDIHDEIGQNLTVLKLDLEWICPRIPAESSELRERLNEMRASVDQLTAGVQRIAADLRSPLLDNMGLTAAIGWHVSEFSKRSGLECFVMLNENIEPLDQKLSTAVMRILQEGLTNIARHASATEVTVSLCKKEGTLILEISDNGCGITPEQIASPEAYGLMGMQERVRICRGEIEINGKPGCGTILHLTIPLDADYVKSCMKNRGIKMEPSEM